MPHITSSTISNADANNELTTLAAKGLPVYYPPVAQPTTDNSGKKREGVTEGGDVEDGRFTPEGLRTSPYDYEGIPGYYEPAGEAPPPKALKADWVAHVVATTDLDQQTAEGLTKAQLQEIANGGELSSAGTNSSTSGSKPDKSGSSVPEMGSSSPSPVPTTESPSSQDPASRPAQSSTAPSASGSTQETGLSQADPSNSSGEQATPAPSGTEATQPLSGEALIHQARLAYEAGNWDEARSLLRAAKDADASVAEEVDMALEAVDTASAGYSSEDPSAGGALIP